MTRKTNFFQRCSWFRLNKLRGGATILNRVKDETSLKLTVQCHPTEIISFVSNCRLYYAIQDCRFIVFLKKIFPINHFLIISKILAIACFWYWISRRCGTGRFRVWNLHPRSKEISWLINISRFSTSSSHWRYIFEKWSFRKALLT